ncbi:unnamed protein product, partial [Cladocopium goreaui]
VDLGKSPVIFRDLGRGPKRPPAVHGEMQRLLVTWLVADAELLSDELLQERAENSIATSLRDFWFASAGGYTPLVRQEDLAPLLTDHLSVRPLNAAWERPPRREAGGAACGNGGTRTPRCPLPDPSLCIDQLLPLLFKEVNHAMAFIHAQVEVLDAAAQITGTSEESILPPLFGRAHAAAKALDMVLGLFLGFFERVDFNPALAACLTTLMGQKMKDAVMLVLEDRKIMSVRLDEMRWELSAFGRLAHAKMGSQWHADTAFFVASKAEWALYHLVRLDGYFADQLGLGMAVAVDDVDQWPDDLLQPVDVDISSTAWDLELRTALHLEGEFWHLDKGLLRFLLREVLVMDEVVCDLGAFGGHYSQWLNDTGLVTAYAFDGAEGVERLTQGRVRHARLEEAMALPESCNVVLCLEVLEHIPRHQEPMALWNLKRLAPRVLIASWAPPHVPGPGHVNPRENAEAWRRLEEATGLERHPQLSQRAQEHSSIQWIRESVAIFKRGDRG